MENSSIHKVNWGNIAKLLRDHPKHYQRYGAYWWTVKQMLREHGQDFGSTDDFEMRERTEAAIPDQLERWYAGVDYQQWHASNAFLNGVHLLDDGTRYELDDPDMRF